MAILAVVKYPHKVLKAPCVPVENSEINQNLQSFLDDMITTMYADNGMGLAANQVNVPKRIFIMDESPEQKQPIIFMNPEIMLQSEEMTEDQEGCLSFPGITLKIKRPKYIKMRALNREGEEFILEREDYSARCLHHELDHLNGITFFDHLSALKRQLAEAKLKKYLRTTL